MMCYFNCFRISFLLFFFVGGVGVCIGELCVLVGGLSCHPAGIVIMDF